MEIESNCQTGHNGCKHSSSCHYSVCCCSFCFKTKWMYAKIFHLFSNICRHWDCQQYYTGLDFQVAEYLIQLIKNAFYTNVDCVCLLIAPLLILHFSHLSFTYGVCMTQPVPALSHHSYFKIRITQPLLFTWHWWAILVLSAGEISGIAHSHLWRHI